MRAATPPQVRFGKPTVRGTQITVGDALSYLAAYDSEDEVRSAERRSATPTVWVSSLKAGRQLPAAG